MSNDKTALGDRMKRHEEPTQLVLPRRTYTIVRVDGRSFHTYLRKAAKPFDYDFIVDMQEVAEVMAHEMGGCRLAYTQSDEISFLLTDFESLGSEPFFGGKVQKIASIAASMATSLLIKQRGTAGWPQFDARVFTINDPVEVANYFIWRQRDAMRNSVSMAAQAHFSHTALQGKSGAEMQEMLFQERGVSWTDYPTEAKRGSVAVKMSGLRPFTYRDKTGQEIQGEAERSWWGTMSAPDFVVDADGFLASQIPALPTLGVRSGS